MQISGWCDWTLEKIFGGFGKWDAVYFLKIAEEGYKYEQYMAFFPFYPWIFERTLHLVLQYFVSERRLLPACGCVLNTVFFALAATVFVYSRQLLECWIFTLNGNLSNFNTIIRFFRFPKCTLNFGCNWQQPIPWFGDFYSVQCPISASCLASASLRALTNFLYIQFHSTYMYLHC